MLDAISIGMTTYQIIDLIIAGVSAVAFTGTLIFAVLAYRLQRSDYHNANQARVRSAEAMAHAIRNCIGMAMTEWTQEQEF